MTLLSMGQWFFGKPRLDISNDSFTMGMWNIVDDVLIMRIFCKIRWKSTTPPSQYQHPYEIEENVLWDALDNAVCVILCVFRFHDYAYQNQAWKLYIYSLSVDTDRKWAIDAMRKIELKMFKWFAITMTD